MLNFNAKIKKSVASVLMCFMGLFAVLNPICCFKANATLEGDNPNENSSLQNKNSGNQGDSPENENTSGANSDNSPNDSNDGRIPVAIIQMGQDQYIVAPCNIC